MWVLCGVYQILQQNYLSTKNIGGPNGAQCAKMDWGPNDSGLLPWNFAAQLKISHVYFITIYISSSTHESYYWEKIKKLALTLIEPSIGASLCLHRQYSRRWASYWTRYKRWCSYVTAAWQATASPADLSPILMWALATGGRRCTPSLPYLPDVHAARQAAASPADPSPV